MNYLHCIIYIELSTLNYLHWIIYIELLALNYLHWITYIELLALLIEYIIDFSTDFSTDSWTTPGHSGMFWKLYGMPPPGHLTRFGNFRPTGTNVSNVSNKLFSSQTQMLPINVSNKLFSGPQARLFCQALISISREKTNATREKFNKCKRRKENKGKGKTREI